MTKTFQISMIVGTKTITITDVNYEIKKETSINKFVAKCHKYSLVVTADSEAKAEEELLSSLKSYLKVALYSPYGNK